jgi:hypothetical protein
MRAMIMGQREAAHRRHACLDSRHAWPRDYCFISDVAVIFDDLAADPG